MSIITDFLKLFKYDPETDGASTFNIKQCLNDNWDKIDAWASGIKTTIAGLVPGTRKVNGKELSADVTLTGEDIKTSASDETTISSQLSNLESALTTPPQEFSLPLSTGWSTNNGCLYRKTQDSMVVIIAQFVLNSGATASDGMELATLPEGFRPRSYLIVPACMQDGSERLSCVVQISTSGEMIYNGKANTTSVFRVYLNTSFFAAS